MPPKIENLQNLLNSYSQEQAEYVYCQSLEFLQNILCQFHLFWLPNSAQAEAYSEPYQRFKMHFWGKIINSSRGVFTMESNIWDNSFLRKIFSGIHYFSQGLFTQMFESIWSMPLEHDFCKGSILMFDWVLDMPQICLKKDKTVKNLWMSHF